MNNQTKITIAVCIVVAASIYFIYNAYSELRDEVDQLRTEVLKLRNL